MSISSITQQYAKQRQLKERQKGGAMFDFLKTGDSAAPAASSSDSVPKNGEEDKDKDKGILDTIKEKLNIGTNNSEEAQASEPALEVSEDKKEEGVAKDKPGMLSGLFGLGSSSSDKEEKTPETNEEDDGDKASEASDGSEASEDNDDDFDMIARKMTTLREKYDKLKTDYSSLKDKMNEQKAEEKKNR